MPITTILRLPLQATRNDTPFAPQDDETPVPVMRTPAHQDHLPLPMLRDMLLRRRAEETHRRKVEAERREAIARYGLD